MGNVLFTWSGSTGDIVAVRVDDRRRRSSRLKMAFICGCGAPSTKQKERSMNGKRSMNHRSEGLVRPGVRRNVSAIKKEQRSSNTRSRSPRSASISPCPSPSDNSQESFLCSSEMEGPYDDTPLSFYSATSRLSPDRTRISFDREYYQQRDQQPSVNSLSSHSSPMSCSSPDISSPTSCSSLLIDSSPDTRRKNLNQHFDQQRSVHSPTSCPSPVTSAPSPDLRRMYFNQHCYQQLQSASSKKHRSPRKITVKPNSLKSSRRRRTGMRSPSHRTSNRRSPGRVLLASYEEKEDKRIEVHSQLHRTSLARSLKVYLEEDEGKRSGKRYEILQSQTTRTSKSTRKSTTLEGLLKGCNDERDDEKEEKHNKVPSPSRSICYSPSSGITLNLRNGDDHENSDSRYTSFCDGKQVVGRVVSSPISRRVAQALISRHKLFANRKNSSSSDGGNCRRQCWKPALESISEAADCEAF